MRRVLPEPDVLQMNLRPMVRRVQRMSDHSIHVGAISKLLNCILFAHMEIVKQKTWAAVPVRWDLKIREKIADLLVCNVVWRNPDWRLRVLQKCLNRFAKHFRLLSNLI